MSNSTWFARMYVRGFAVVIAAGLCLSFAGFLLLVYGEGGLPVYLKSVSAPYMLYYGETLSDSPLSGVFCAEPEGLQQVNGTIEWDDPSTIPEVGNTGYPYTFTPFDSSYQNYRGTAVVSVEPEPLTLKNITAASKQYDGTTVAQLASGELGNILPGDDVVLEIDAVFADPNVGSAKTVQISASLAGASAQNYALTKSSYTAKADILPYEGVSCEEIPVSLPEVAGPSSLLLGDHLLPIGPGEPGICSYTILSFSDPSGLLVAQPTISGQQLSFQSTDTGGSSAELSIRIESQNYAPITGTLRFARGLTQVAVSGVTVEDKTYDGGPVSPSGTPLVGDSPLTDAVYRYTGPGYDSAEPPRDAGAYQLIVSIPPDHPTLSGSSAPILFEIHPAPLTLRPRDVTVTVGDALPTDFPVDCFGLVDGESAALLDPQPQAGSALTGTETVTTTPIKILNEPKARNYMITLEQGLLTVTSAEGGGENPGDGDGGGTITPPPAPGSLSRRTSGSSGATSIRDGASTASFWAIVMNRIRDVEPGGTVRVMTAVGDDLPAGVLTALRGRDVTLRIIHTGGDIRLHGQNLPAADSSVTGYSLATLATIAELPGSTQSPAALKLIASTDERQLTVESSAEPAPESAAAAQMQEQAPSAEAILPEAPDTPPQAVQTFALAATAEGPLPSATQSWSSSLPLILPPCRVGLLPAATISPVRSERG